MHSSNQFVTQGRFCAWLPIMTSVFHAQVIDLEKDSRVGTFFTNLCGELVFTALRVCCRRDSTDLSTVRVDKPQSPFASDSCVIYVMFEARMTRNCKLRRTATRPAVSECVFGRVFTGLSSGHSSRFATMMG